MGKVVTYNKKSILTAKIKMKNTKDQNIRKALVKELVLEQAKTGHPTRIFSEFGINHGGVRADVVTVNGIIHGYEIKSDADTLSRLPDQAQAYSQVFDKVTLVVGEQHVIEALAVIPSWWGVKLAKGTSSGSVVLTTIRTARKNQKQDKLAISRLLWKQEVIEILESISSDVGIRNKRREFAYERLALVMGKAQLQEKVKDKLFNRPGWRVDQPLLLCGD
jgi:hypothetical protein